MIYAIVETTLAIVATTLLVVVAKSSLSTKEKVFNALLCLLVWSNAIAVWILKAG